MRDVGVGVTAPVVQQLKGDVQRGGQQAADEAPRVEPGSSVWTVQVPHEKHEQVLHDEQDVDDDVPVPGRANGQKQAEVAEDGEKGVEHGVVQPATQNFIRGLFKDPGKHEHHVR